MSAQAYAYGEIIKTIAKFFAGLASSIGSFVGIVAIVAIGTQVPSIVVGGVEVVPSPTLLIVAVASVFLLLFQACVILSLLSFVDNDDVSNNNQ
ncbi:MAG: hypothetical protein AAFQ74_09870 [Cyanobacteria bacterium J06623_4]